MQTPLALACLSLLPLTVGSFNDDLVIEKIIWGSRPNHPQRCAFGARFIWVVNNVFQDKTRETTSFLVKR